VLKSTDGGQSWVAINAGLPGFPTVLSVVVHPSKPDVVYVGLAFGGLYRSEDGGATWQMSAGGMNPEALVSDIVFSPTDSQVMYAADRFSGVYRSVDGGVTWVSISNGLRTRAVNALALSFDGQHLYAATEGEGVYRLDLSGQPPKSVSTSTPVPGQPSRPTSVLASPTAIGVPTIATRLLNEPSEPMPTPGPTPGPSRGRDICRGAAVVPLALLGLTWRRCHKRQREECESLSGAGTGGPG
jgi:hypothetical protein